MEARERLVKAFEELKYLKKVSSQLEFGSKLGYTKSHFSQIMNGAQPFPDKIATSLETTFGISSDWILTGNGEMFKDKPTVAAVLAPSTVVDELKAGFQKIAASFMKGILDSDLKELSEDDRASLNDWMKSSDTLVKRIEERTKKK
eukprot:TRINITY_DN67631_c0_g1_i1.p2 TRINITY_DN67631_c0_g1~~TRINITY_DN67631_c0_g1_i1.p2  ORF type:complete len:146 (-),score=18.89 TRINITY_DN67631_c0_g1_i1:1209-1646(-)